MTLYEFNFLTLEEKLDTVWDKGIFLDNYITEDILINCYAIDKFFVEVVYDGEQKTNPKNKNDNFHLTKYYHRIVKRTAVISKR